MFSNVGGKLKMVAKIFFWAGIIGAIIGGIIVIVNGVNYGLRYDTGKTLLFTGIGIILGGSVTSWIASLGIFAFGEITENSDIRTNLAVKTAMEREQEKKTV